MAEAKDENLDSEINQEPEEKTPEPKEVEKKEVKEDKQDEPDYRPKPKSDEVVPLKKYLDLKTDVKNLKKEIERLSDDKSNLSNKDLESLADEYNLDKDYVKKFASVIEKKTAKEAEKKLAPLLAERQKEQNEKNFDKVFNEKTLKKYPHLADFKEKYKRMVMSPDFVDMTEDQIISDYFPVPSKPTKDDSPENGSQGGSKGDEVIDFSKMSEEQHAKVLDNPKLRAKYFDWQDKQG
jgi:hypothetical protein